MITDFYFIAESQPEFETTAEASESTPLAESEVKVKKRAGLFSKLFRNN